MRLPEHEAAEIGQGAVVAVWEDVSAGRASAEDGDAFVLLVKEEAIRLGRKRLTELGSTVSLTQEDETQSESYDLTDYLRSTPAIQLLYLELQEATSAISHLPDRFSVVMNRVASGWNIGDIAADLGISPAIVLARIVKARILLLGFDLVGTSVDLNFHADQAADSYAAPTIVAGVRE